MRRKEQNRGLSLYVKKYMSAMYTLIHDTPLPRVILEMRHILQLNKDARTGDWYMAEDHTIITVYGFEKEPFKLPSFLTPRILVLEYVRHRMMVDHFLFAQHRKTITFPLPHDVGPFLFNKE